MIRDIDKLPYLEIKQFVLERFVFQSRHIFGKNHLKPNVRIYFRRELNDIVLNIVYYLFGKQQEQEIMITTPKRWIDWFKEKRIGKKWMDWIIKRFPIHRKFHYYDVKKYTTFPDLDLPYDFEKKLELIFYEWSKNEK